MKDTIFATRPTDDIFYFPEFPKVFAKRIRNGYFGLFATRDIKKGELVFFGRGSKIHNIDNDDAPDYPDALRIATNTWINPDHNSPLTYINHSCKPNLGISGRKTFRTLIDIMGGGVELTFDYALSEIDTLWSMDDLCLCGETNCRRIIKSIQSLPTKQISEYLPYIPTWMQAYLSV